MPLNISALPVQLTIGSQNWSASIESISVGYPEYAVGSGLLPASGTIELVFSVFLPLPSEPDYRSNPTQWQRGQTIAIAANGSILPCSGARLFILKPPQRFVRTLNGLAKLSISIGCALALQYFPPEPNDDFAKITPNSPQDRGTIINRVLARLGIISAVVIPPYPIAYPLPKLESNWLDFCGQLADSAGYYLRCNTSGVIVAEKILPRVASSVTYTIGVDEKDWQPIGDVSEQTIEKLIVTGVNYKVSIPSNRTEVNEQKTLVEIDPDTTGFPKTQLLPSKRVITTVEGGGGFFRETIKTFLPLVTVDPDTTSFPRTVLIPSSEERTEYFLDSFGNVLQTTLTKSEALIAIDPDTTSFPREGLIPSEFTITNWTKTGDRKWTKTVDKRLPLVKVDPETTSFPRTELIPASTIVDDADTSGPPQSIGFSQFGLQEEQLTSTVFAAQLASGLTRERQRTINVPFTVSQAQLTEYGRTFNRFLDGRAFGWQFATALNTSLLPFNQVTVIDGMRGYNLYVDAQQWVMSQTEALLIFNGIENGVFDVATPEDVIMPVMFPIGRFTLRLENEWDSALFLIRFTSRLESQWDSSVNRFAMRLRLENQWTAFVGVVTPPIPIIGNNWRTLTDDQWRTLTDDQWRTLTEESTSSLNWRTLTDDDFRTLTDDQWRTLTNG